MKPIGSPTQMHRLTSGLGVRTSWHIGIDRDRARKGFAPIKKKDGHQMPSRKPITLAELPKPRSS